MPSLVYGQIRQALQHLNPKEVRELAERPVSIGLVASSHEGFAAMEQLLVPSSLSQERREETLRSLHRVGHPGRQADFDVVIAEQELLPPRGAFRFDRERPEDTIQAILDRHEDLAIPLARAFLPFRKPVIARTIRKVARENAVFSVMTALPDVIPSLAELPWAIGEFASDTAFLTMNQVRMAFLIAGASDEEVGYKEQRAQMAGIVAGAFGWRALARELVGKIPFGGGLVPKAAIAYAGTYTMGVGLEHFYRIGSGLTRTQRHDVYRQALDRGRTIVDAIVQNARRHSPAA